MPIDLGPEFDKSLYIIPAVIFNTSRGIYFGYVRVEDYKEILRGRRPHNSIGVYKKRHIFSYKCKDDSLGTSGLINTGPMPGSQIGDEGEEIEALMNIDKVCAISDKSLKAFKAIKWKR